MPFVQFTTLSSNVHEVTQFLSFQLLLLGGFPRKPLGTLFFYHIIETRFHEADENGNYVCVGVSCLCCVHISLVGAHAASTQPPISSPDTGSKNDLLPMWPQVKKSIPIILASYYNCKQRKLLYKNREMRVCK